MTTEPHTDDDFDADDFDTELAQPEPYRDGRVHVMAEKCSTCVFRPGNPMSLRPGQLRELTDHVQETGVPFSCHQTLPYAGAEHIAFYGGAALCAGAVANYAAGSPQMQLAMAMDVVTYVDPAPAEVGKLAPPEPTACEWFAGCVRPAAGVVAHPVLGNVATCQECADRHDLDLVAGQSSRPGSIGEPCGRADAHDAHEWNLRGIFRRQCDGRP